MQRNFGVGRGRRLQLQYQQLADGKPLHPNPSSQDCLLLSRVLNSPFVAKSALHNILLTVGDLFEESTGAKHLPDPVRTYFLHIAQAPTARATQECASVPPGSCADTTQLLEQSPCQTLSPAVWWPSRNTCGLPFGIADFPHVRLEILLQSGGSSRPNPRCMDTNPAQRVRPFRHRFSKAPITNTHH